MRQKKDVVKSIRAITRCIKGKGVTCYEAYLGLDAEGRKIRFTRMTRESLIGAVNDFFALHRKTGDTAMAVLTPYQIHDARAALDALVGSGRQDVGLAECAREFLRMAGDGGRLNDKPVKDAYSDYLASFPERTRGVHFQAVRSRVGKWVATCGERMCGEVTAADVAAYLSPMRGGPETTYNNALGYIKTFMAWCAAPERRHIRESPVASMKKLKKPYAEPEFMRAGDVEAVLRILERDGDGASVCYFTLSFLMGMRTEEIKRMSREPESFRLEDGTIRITKPKGWTSGRPPRLIHVPENTLAWLEKHDVRESITRMSSHTAGRIRRLVKKHRADIRFPHNAGRHTFITMHYAAYGDPSKTAALCGTSRTVMTNHYMGLADRAEGERYFGIMPQGVRGEDKEGQLRGESHQPPDAFTPQGV